MSIKSELANLRRNQEKLAGLIEDFSTKIDRKKSQQKSTSNAVEQFAKKKSELAVKLYQEYIKKLEVQDQEISELCSTLEQYRKEYSSNEEKIKSYLEDTSLYINEQIPILIQKFIKYVEDHEFELGTNITSRFVFDVIKDNHSTREANIFIPNGNFCIKKITEPDDVIVAETNDYYFERNICTIDDRAFGSARIYPENWYTKYAEDFKKAFLDSLAKEFMSKNFKLTVNGDSFTLDLI